MASWTLAYDARPWLVNEERSGGTRGMGGWRGRAVAAREWRETFAWLAVAQHVPKLDRVRVTVHHQAAKRPGPLPDVCAVHGPFKAALDGIVDAGVLPDDGPAHVLSVTFTAPTRGDRDLVTVVLEDAGG